jgi:hypothetical protein
MTANFFKKIKDKKAQSREGNSAIEYFLNERVAKGTSRVLQGNVELTKSIINDISFKSKATVGCLSFTEKNLDEKCKYEIMASFENMLFPALSKDDYNILWVEHTDKDMLELNFVIPKIHLTSQKSLQTYYFKQDQKRKDLWQQKINTQYNLTNPLEIKRQRAVDVTKNAYKSNEYQKLDEKIKELVNNKILTSRDTIINYLKDNNISVTRTSKDSISIKLIDTKKARRFKDIIYSEKFTSLLILEELKQQQNEQIIKENKPINNSEKSVTIDNINKEYNKYLNYKRKQQSQKYNINNEQTKDNHETKDIDTTAFAGYKAKKEYDKRTNRYYKTLQLRVRQIRTITIQRASTYEQTTFRRFESSRGEIINSIRELILTVFSKLSNLLDKLGFGDKKVDDKKDINNSVRRYK